MGDEAGGAHCYHKPPGRARLAPTGRRRWTEGDILISEIRGTWITRITRAGKVVVGACRAPHISYPSDAFPTVDGTQVIVADFREAGAAW